MTSGLSAAGAEADNGGIKTLDGGKIGIAGAGSVGLLAANGTITVNGALAISTTGTVYLQRAEVTFWGMVSAASRFGR
jgi:hypothetical protein